MKRTQLRLPDHIYDWFVRKQGKMLLSGKRISLNSLFMNALEKHVLNDADNKGIYTKELSAEDMSGDTVHVHLDDQS